MKLSAYRPSLLEQLPLDTYFNFIFFGKPHKAPVTRSHLRKTVDLVGNNPAKATKFKIQLILQINICLLHLPTGMTDIRSLQLEQNHLHPLIAFNKENIITPLCSPMSRHIAIGFYFSEIKPLSVMGNIPAAVFLS